MTGTEYDELPSRRWIRSRAAIHILIGIASATGITLAAWATSLAVKSPYLDFLIARGPLQPIMLAMTLMLISYSATRRKRIAREQASVRSNWLFIRGEFKQEGEALRETISVLMARSDILANRQLRILQSLKESKSRSISKEVCEEDNSLTEEEIAQNYYLPKTVVWSLPMLGFLGTVTGISGSVSGFSGLLEGASNIELIKSSLNSVMTGLSTAFDTTILGIVSALISTLVLSLTEQQEFDLSQSINIHINDKLFARIGKDGSFE